MKLTKRGLDNQYILGRSRSNVLNISIMSCIANSSSCFDRESSYLKQLLLMVCQLQQRLRGTVMPLESKVKAKYTKSVLMLVKQTFSFYIVALYFLQ